LTIGAREAFSMKRLIFVAHAALRNNLGAFGAFGRVVLLVAGHTVDFVVLWYETLRADGQIARETEKAVLVKLLTLVFHFFHARLEYLRALVTARRERLVIALAAVEAIVLVAEGLVHEPNAAQTAKEALLVPVHVLVGEILGVGADLALA
jgi:hypothetical protein